jgi:hypothetical protein
MPVKKTKKPRARRAPAAKKKGLKQKQKQRQEQKVNVSVSAGGSGGGGTQFIPMPSAPAFDYAQLASLLRPANTVDVPIRAQDNPELIAARDAEEPSLMEELPSAKARKVRSDAGKSRKKASSSSAQAYFEEPESGSESELNAQMAFERIKAAKERSAFIE